MKERRHPPASLIDIRNPLSLACPTMWPNLTYDDRAFWKSTAAFARERVLPHVLDWDRRAILPRHLWRDMVAQGLLGLPFPQEVGGSAGGAVRTALAMDAFAYGSKDLGIANSWGVHTAMVGMALVNFGSPEQQRAYLPAMAAGDVVTAFALTESDAGIPCRGHSDFHPPRRRRLRRHGRQVLRHQCPGCRSFRRCWPHGRGRV